MLAINNTLKTVPDDQVRNTLAYLLQQYGNSLLNAPKRCEALLHDLCPQQKLEVNLLMAAMDEQVPAELSSAPANMPIDLALQRLSKRLQENLGIVENCAVWAVESWALALGAISTAELKQTQSGTEPVNPAKKWFYLIGGLTVCFSAIIAGLVYTNYRTESKLKQFNQELTQQLAVQRSNLTSQVEKRLQLQTELAYKQQEEQMSSGESGQKLLELQNLLATEKEQRLKLKASLVEKQQQIDKLQADLHQQTTLLVSERQERLRLQSRLHPGQTKPGCEFKSIMSDEDYRNCNITPPTAAN